MLNLTRFSLVGAAYRQPAAAVNLNRAEQTPYAQTMPQVDRHSLSLPSSQHFGMAFTQEFENEICYREWDHMLQGAEADIEKILQQGNRLKPWPESVTLSSKIRERLNSLATLFYGHQTTVKPAIVNYIKCLSINKSHFVKSDHSSGEHKQAFKRSICFFVSGV